MRFRHYILIITIGFILLALVFILYFETHGERFLGKLSIKGVNAHVNIYQEKKFDSSTTLMYELVSNGRTIVDRHFLSGTSDYEKISSFKADVCDSILYVTFFDPHVVYVMHDLKTELGYPHRRSDEDYEETSARGLKIFENLKVCNNFLILN